MKSVYTDVFVIGGGPAGLAAAIAASREGMCVIVSDGETAPIDKPCGEGLMPDSRLLARNLGIEIPTSTGYEFRGIRFHGADRSVAADFCAGRGIGIRRTALHRALVRAAERAGVEFRWGSPVSGLENIKARWIIGADGSSSLVRRWAGLDAVASHSRRYAYRQHFAIAPWTDYMEIHWGDGCQIYVTPVAAREVCVALVSRRQDLRLGEALDRYFPVLRARLRPGFETSRERGAVTGNVTLRAVARGNVALIGDASGSVDAIAGEGICLGFRQAEALAEALAKGDLAAYDSKHRWLALRPHLMAKTMLQLDRGQLMQRVAMAVLQAQPWIFRELLRVHVA
jgi:flavin-dependent dehydrogenase